MSTRSSRVWDTFLFFNELDMLECRLTELEEAPVHRFVLVESPVTFQGRPKKLYYAENCRRFMRWSHKIVHVIAEPEGTTPWEREKNQREAIFRGLHGARPADLIMLSDVDEIPRADMVTERMYPGLAFLMRNHIFTANWVHPEGWLGTTVQYYGHVHSFDTLRRNRFVWPRVPDAGWHLSYFGGADAVRAKVTAYSHTELTRPFLDWVSKGQSYREGVDITSPLYEKDLLPREWMEVDDSFPRWIKEKKCPANWIISRDKHAIGEL
jgi:Glycosyltransferase family 17